MRVCSTHTESSGKRPAQRAGLAAVDPIARLIDVQELSPRNLRKADRRHIACVAIEALVHLLIDALRLERDLIEVRPAEHVVLAMQTLGGPLVPILQFSFRLQRARRVNEKLERRPRIGDNAKVRAEHPANLRRLDIDMNELASLGVEINRPGVAIGPSVADAKN